MGYSTTFTIDHDRFRKLSDKEKVQLVDELYSALMRSGNCDIVSPWDIKVQKSRDADDTTIYLHQGNTLHEMNPHSNITQRLFQDHPELAKEYIDVMESEVGELRRRLNEMASGKE